MKITFDTFLTQLMISAFFYPKTLFFVLFIFIFIFFTIIYLLYRHHKQSFSPDECLDTEKGILETFPDGYYYWLYDSIGFIKKTYCSRRLSIMLDLPQGLDTTFDVFAGRFTHQSVDILNTALNDMRQDGSPFRIEVQTLLDSRSFLISGFRTLTPKNENTLDVLWVRETTQTVKELSTLTNIAQKRKRQNTLYIQSLNALPFPVWLRDEDLHIFLYNNAYTQMLKTDSAQQDGLSGNEWKDQVFFRKASTLAAEALSSGKKETDQETIIINDCPCRVEICEIPLSTQSLSKKHTLGFIRDISKELELENRLQRYIVSHNSVLEHLKTAVAVFDPRMHLQFYNTSFTKLWGLESEWLDQAPTYSHLLDLLREKHRLPENRDFNAYKTRELKYFTSLVSTTEDFLHLPCGKTLRRMLTPHPLGGLLITYEDVTGHLTMERSMVVLNETQYTVVNHLREAILLFGQDRRLRLANTAYLTLWQIDTPYFNTPALTISEVLERQKPFFENETNWEILKEQFLSVILSHTGEIFQIFRPDGKVLEFIAVGLPDNGIFVSFLDVTEEEKSSALTQEKETLLRHFRQPDISSA